VIVVAFNRITEPDRYLCAAADNKPTTGIKLGSKCLETDTDKVFIFNGTTWVEITGLNF
jgi:hypothetical protein